MPVGRKRSLFFEFIVLQRKVRFTDHPVFEKVGTGSGFWKKNQKARFKSLRSAKMSFCYYVHCERPSKARFFHCHFVRAEDLFCCVAGSLDYFRVIQPEM
jgi:hypothetical protein